MSTMMVAGNWKMNASTLTNTDLTNALVAGAATLTNVQMVVFPPAPYLGQVQELLADSAIALGAQNVSDKAQGAYTGEVSATMLKDFGVKYVLVGHSERRSLYGESDAIVAAKFKAVKTAGLIPVLCIGETLAQREAEATLDVVNGQLQAVIDLVGVAELATAVVAYEPVWAIGTGLTASPEQAQEVHQAIRAYLATQDAAVAEQVQILYGGSVNAATANELFAQSDIDGGLVGGASLDAQAFLAIGQAAQS
ncbi:MAG TPA: triose-phosphate isomerase [Oceanospirillaceae bacterium]|jgi:triosephosphate isomerase|nr:triose-phosphate isomerase [Oceanospirillaceae bacterium]HBD22866.1 triose-phosphate isomerase [Oceanospirillaceae bacterium]HCI02375.1 triose-phosphate isomerase [Oceanospirillaceae bacterium]